MLMFTMIIIFGSHQLIAHIVVDLHLFARSSKFEAQIKVVMTMKVAIVILMMMSR